MRKYKFVRGGAIIVIDGIRDYAMKPLNI